MKAFGYAAQHAGDVDGGQPVRGGSFNLPDIAPCAFDVGNRW